MQVLQSSQHLPEKSFDIVRKSSYFFWNAFELAEHAHLFASDNQVKRVVRFGFTQQQSHLIVFRSLVEVLAIIIERLSDDFFLFFFFKRTDGNFLQRGLTLMQRIKAIAVECADNYPESSRQYVRQPFDCVREVTFIKLIECVEYQ